MAYTTFDTVVLLAGSLSLYCIGLAVSRLYFHPLSNFPGPKLAATTLWFEFYYEVIQKGQLTFKIQEWHKKYGPIIRINPNEIHIDDPTGDFYHTVFSGSSPRNKDSYYTSQFGTPMSIFGTVDHSLHRNRRRAINPFFSKASINRLLPVIQSKVRKLCARLDEVKGSNTPLNMRLVYTCLTTDVITSYAFNNCWDHLDSEDWSPLWCKTLANAGQMTKWTKQFPWLWNVIRKSPISIIRIFNPGLPLVIGTIHVLKNEVKTIMKSQPKSHHQHKKQQEKPISPAEKSETDEETPSRTIFHELLKADLPPDEVNIPHFTQQAQNLIGAGSDTTSNALANITFYVLSDRRVLEKLRRELEVAMPDRFGEWDLKLAESLPYLGGIIQEGLRLSYGVSSRLTRVAPEEDLNFNDWIIPRGTPVGMTAILMHHNERIFPDSHSFLPERWTDSSDGGRALERYMVTFSKGSRMCIGINLAKAELYLTLATIFRRYEMELFETVFERDVQLKHDFFLPQPSEGSMGVRVVFK